jgi:hypothetical protein
MSAKAWTLLTVVVLYLLSVGPLFAVCHRAKLIEPFAPRWLELYAAPEDWLIEHTPLGIPLLEYNAFWTTRLLP